MKIPIAQLIPVFSGLKSWIFSDGKFNLNRTLVLVCTLVLLIFSSRYIPLESLEYIVDILDDVSDIYGYQ